MIPYNFQFIHSESPFVTMSLIDTEKFGMFMKEIASANESILMDYTSLRWNTPISNRIPTEIETPAEGFDAGLAALFGFIPPEHITFVLNLHIGNYNEKTVSQMTVEVEQIRNSNGDSMNLDNLSTYWWLAMSSLCKEGYATTQDFYNQYHNAVRIFTDHNIRYEAALAAIELISNKFNIDPKTSLPFGTVDGCIQAAYMAGHQVATMYADSYDLYFLGTYVPGKLDNIINHFSFSETTDDNGRSKSGVINPTFLKFATHQEMINATALL